MRLFARRYSSEESAARPETMAHVRRIQDAAAVGSWTQELQLVGRIWLKQAGGDGPAVEVTLSEVASEGLQLLDLWESLDALGDDREPEGASEADDRSHDRCVVGPVVEVVNEAPVDLQALDREALKVAEGGIPGPEVVDLHMYPELPGTP